MQNIINKIEYYPTATFAMIIPGLGIINDSPYFDGAAAEVIRASAKIAIKNALRRKTRNILLLMGFGHLITNILPDKVRRWYGFES